MQMERIIILDDTYIFVIVFFKYKINIICAKLFKFLFQYNDCLHSISIFTTQIFQYSFPLKNMEYLIQTLKAHQDVKHLVFLLLRHSKQFLHIAEESMLDL